MIIIEIKLITKNAYKKSLCIKCSINNMQTAALLNNASLIRTVQVSTLTEDQEFYKTVDLYFFSTWFEDHKNHNINWYINNRDTVYTYNYELLTFYDICKMYIKNFNSKIELCDRRYYNNTNLNYLYLKLLNSIKIILEYKYTYNFDDFNKYIYLIDIIQPIIKQIKRTNKKYKEYKYIINE